MCLIDCAEMEIPYRAKAGGGDDDDGGGEEGSEYRENDGYNGGNAGIAGADGETSGTGAAGAENRLYNGYQGSLMEVGDNSVPHDSYERAVGSHCYASIQLFIYAVPVTMTVVSRWCFI